MCPSPLTLRRLGSSDVQVTSLGFGAAPIGNLYRPIDDDVAQAAVDAAWDGGVRYFDTAPHYGLGLSERRLGAALAARPRAEYTVSSKVGRLLTANPDPVGSDLHSGGFAVPDDLTRVRDYSRDGVRRSLESSLDRLGLTRIDIAYVHDPEDYLDEAIRQAIPALVELREQGVLGAVGAGMNFVEPLRRIVATADVDAVMVAGRYTLIDRTGQELLDECLARGVSVVAAAPFNSGLLARAWPADCAYFDYGPAAPEMLARARDYATRCRSLGTGLPHAALQFPLTHPSVACVVAGSRTATQVQDAVRWMTTSPPRSLWNALEADPPAFAAEDRR